ncbi:MAG: hypothetical protein R3B54_14590 [Bdellovibrionota bacterium]
MRISTKKAVPLLIGTIVLFAATVIAGEREERACGVTHRTIAESGTPDSSGSARPMSLAKTPAEIKKAQAALLTTIQSRFRDSHPYSIGAGDYYINKMLIHLVERGIIRDVSDVPKDMTDAEITEWLASNYASDRFKQTVERDVERRLTDLRRAGVVNEKNQPPKDPAELVAWVDTEHAKAIKNGKLDPAKSPVLLDELAKQYRNYTSHPQKFENKEELADATAKVLARTSSLMTAALRADAWQMGRPAFEKAVRENPDYEWAQKHVQSLRRDDSYVRDNTGMRYALWEYVDPKATFPQKDIRKGAMQELSAAVAQKVADETGYDSSFVRFVMNRFEVTETGGGRISPLLDTADLGSLGFLGGSSRRSF